MSDLGNEYIICKLKNSQYNTPTVFYLLIYHNYLLFCKPDDNDNQYCYLKHKHALRHVEVQIDRSNPRILYLAVKEVSK